MKRLRGFAIVSAIFILVVLAALGAFIVNISTSQQIGSALDVQGVRAYQAARAGIEWGLYQVNATPAYNFSYGDGTSTPQAVEAVNPNLRSCASASGTFTPAAPTLSGFKVTVACTQSDPTLALPGEPIVFTLISTACSEAPCPNTTNPGALYIERRLQVSL